MEQGKIKYSEKKISELNREENDLLTAAITICKKAIWLKKNLSIGDDGEWDYGLNKALSAYKNDIEEISEIEPDLEIKNIYSGDLTLETLIQQFEDFYWLVNSTSPLGKEEVDFVIAYGFLEARVKSRKEILTNSSNNYSKQKQHKVKTRKVKKFWYEKPLGILILAIGAGLVVAFLSFSFGWV